MSPLQAFPECWGSRGSSRLGTAPLLEAFPAPGGEPRVAAALSGGTWFTAVSAPSYRTGKEHEETDYKHMYTCASTVRAAVQRAYASASLRRLQHSVNSI